MAAFAKVNGLKACPACKTWTEKKSGCDYIDCRCGAFWCYKCTALYDTKTKRCKRCGMHHAFVPNNNPGEDEEWENYKMRMMHGGGGKGGKKKGKMPPQKVKGKKKRK